MCVPRHSEVASFLPTMLAIKANFSELPPNLSLNEKTLLKQLASFCSILFYYLNSISTLKKQ